MLGLSFVNDYLIQVTIEKKIWKSSNNIILCGHIYYKIEQIESNLAYALL